MKHFLGILILFSGLSYAEDTNNGKGSIEVLESLISESLKNKHDKTQKELRESSERHDKVNAKDILLFCDANDKKLDLKKRFFFIISTEVKYGFLEYYDYGTLYLMASLTHVKESPSIYEIESKTLNMKFQVNRFNLDMNGGTRKCFKATKSQYLKARNEVKKMAKLVRDKRKI